MNKLLDWAERKCGSIVRDALRNAIVLSGALLAVALIVTEMICGYYALQMLPEHFGRGLVYLVLDFAAFTVTVFFAFWLYGWSECNE